jgi:flagellar motor switch protein FliM
VSELLTQDEVNALLQSVPLMEEATQKISVPLERPSPARYRKRASRYDFKRPNRISKNVLQSVHFLHERYARNLSLNLSAYLRTTADVVLLNVDQLSYAEFLMSLPETTCINVVSILPQGGMLGFELNPTLVFAVIEKLMGGSSETPSQNREITVLEQHLIEGFIQMSLRDLREAWQTIGETNFVLDRQETSPQLVQIVAPNEIVVVIVFEVKIGHTSGMMNFCIPAIYLDPFAMELRQENRTDIRTRMSPEDHRRLDEVLARAEAALAVDLAERRIPIRELLALKEGDILALGKPMSDSVVVKIAGIPKYRAAFGSRNGKKAAKILANLAEEDGAEAPAEGVFELVGGMGRNG